MGVWNWNGAVFIVSQGLVVVKHGVAIEQARAV